MNTATEIIEMEQHQTAIASQEAVPANSPMAMAIAAMQSGMSPDQIGAMMDLQDRYNATQAKKAYDEAFAAFKAEAVKIVKGKDVTAGPLKGTRYAVLNDVVKAVTPALSEHGLSSSWKLTRDEPDWMEITCFLRHVGGHQESVSMGGPPDSGPGRNAIQARASTKTYLERYTLKAITGLSEQDDDTDGATQVDTAIIDDWVSAAEGAASIEELDTTWRDGLREIKKTDSMAIYERFKDAVSTSKKRLEKK